MKYIMVTDFEKHWDNIESNFTSYTPRMIKGKKSNKDYISGTETIFIKKIRDLDKVEKAWIGKVTDIQPTPGKVFFRIVIIKEVTCPPEYANYKNGWYIEI